MFKQLIEERTDGRITVTVHAGDIITDDAEGVELLQTGNLDMGWLAATNLSSFAPDLMIFNLPFLFRDLDHLNNVLAGPVGQDLLDRVTANVSGVQALGFNEDGWRQITNNKNPINSLADFKGMKIRAMKSDMNIDMYQALGATPVSLPWGELYTALQTGVADAQDNDILTSETNGLLEVQPYVAVVDHFYSAGIALMSDKLWNSLSGDDQALVKSAAEEAGKLQRDWDKQTIGELSESLTASGKIEITYPDDRDAWVAACEPVVEKYIELYPDWADIVEAIRNTD
jgi:tripartite ATP-independent transporter DctP family solute receptor